ncbi:MAG: hypothetical protein SGCHY_005419, partial [Lobulomycetales sp.]
GGNRFGNQQVQPLPLPLPQTQTQTQTQPLAFDGGGEAEADLLLSLKHSLVKAHHHQASANPFSPPSSIAEPSKEYLALLSQQNQLYERLQEIGAALDSVHASSLEIKKRLH